MRAPVVTLLCLLALLAPTPAHADDTRPCVSRAELHHVHHASTDYTKPRLDLLWDVTGIHGTPSLLLPPQSFTTYAYPRCAGGTVYVSYDHSDNLRILGYEDLTS